MSKPKASGWSLVYKDPRSSVALLVNLPPDMLRDLHMIAKADGISASEFVRRAITFEIATFLGERPEVIKSFRGRLPTNPETTRNRAGT